MQPAVYIVASKQYGVLYTGVTSDLVGRAWKHRTGALEGFTKRYHARMLVYFEFHATMKEAIRREKQIKEWRRSWKIALIESVNPDWNDLWPTVANDPEGRPRLSPG